MQIGAPPRQCHWQKQLDLSQLALLWSEVKREATPNEGQTTEAAGARQLEESQGCCGSKDEEQRSPDVPNHLRHAEHTR
jgi:hypothetical protein